MAPKYGTLVPNRIFVGGISASTTEAELAQAFSVWGNVKATKIISDRAGVSKGYGFVTFETEEEAKRLQQEVCSRLDFCNYFSQIVEYTVSYCRFLFISLGWLYCTTREEAQHSTRDQEATIF